MPAARELVAVDRSGEPDWLFGSEDVAGDGAGSFEPNEREIDLRSAYAAQALGRLWLRVYVSAETTPRDLGVLVFLDTDRNAATGGSRRAREIDDVLQDEPEQGGYEIVLSLASGDTLAGAWRWTTMPNRFEPLSDLEPLAPVAESGIDNDPLRIGSGERGYRQVSVELAGLELDAACTAQLSFWASDGDAIIDRELGADGPCVGVDANDNGLSDVAETDDSCISDAQCPAGGVCRQGRCVAPAQVTDDGDPGPSNAEQPGVNVAEGDVVQGGAFSCAMRARPAQASKAGMVNAGATAALSLALSAWFRRRGRGSR